MKEYSKSKLNRVKRGADRTVWIDNKTYLHGSIGNRMLQSLLSLETVSITITHFNALVLARSGFHHFVNYRSATIFRTPKKIEDDEQKEIALKCVLAYMIPGRWNSIREMNQTLMIEISIDTASAKVRNVGTIDEPEHETLPIWTGIVPIVQKAESPISDEKWAQNINIPTHVTEYYKKHQ